MNKKKTYMVIYDYGQGGIWFLMDAYSKVEIENLRPEFVVFDDESLPTWMTPERKKEFLEYCEQQKHHWDIEKEPTGWLATCLASPWPKGSTSSEVVETILNLNGNDTDAVARRMGVSTDFISDVSKGKIELTREQRKIIKMLVEEYVKSNR